jgi:transcription termination factor Rho
MHGSNDKNKVAGVLEGLDRGSGMLRDPATSFEPSRWDTWVPPGLIREYGLVEGAMVIGTARQGEKGIQLHAVESVCGLSPERFRARPRFDTLQAVNPTERIRLGDSGILSMRVVDLIAPVGKGTRGLIVAPPKTGKTRMLEDMANAVRGTDPAARILVLLIDERPEEVTHFRRSVDAEVLASSSDKSVESHVRLAELTLAHIRTDLECGRDVVVLVDSLTRMARAFNQATPGSRRTLSGGVDAKALEIPRRFFGLARKAEHGGSVTVIATAMVNTGSRMDDYIFEEFKGTGNSEIVLDRLLADARIFPAIHIQSSGTRREELLCTEEEIHLISSLRQRLAGEEPKTAMQKLIRMLELARTNQDLIKEQALDV